MKNKLILGVTVLLLQYFVFAYISIYAKKTNISETNFSEGSGGHLTSHFPKAFFLLPPNVAPIAKAGIDTAMQLPTDSLILRGCTSSDPEGAVLKYKWRKVSGPTSLQIVYDTACQTRIRALLAGDYVFELAVTDTGGLVAKDSVLVKVYPQFTTNWPEPATTLCSRIYKVVVVGSSTAFGTGASPIDSSWVRKFRTYVLAQNAAIQVINIATLGLTSYDVSPTGTVVPAPFTVDIDRNITKALSFNPDAIILNLPSNDVARGIPTNTIHQNMLNITNAANAQNVPIWVSTTQPRDGLSPSEKILQMELRSCLS